MWLISKLMLYFDTADTAFSSSFIGALCEANIAKDYDKWNSSCRCALHGVAAAVIFGREYQTRKDNKEGNDIQLVLVRHFLNDIVPNKNIKIKIVQKCHNSNPSRVSRHCVCSRSMIQVPNSNPLFCPEHKYHVSVWPFWYF